MFKIKVETNIEGCLIVGRNGTHKLAAIVIEQYEYSGAIVIDGIGSRGKTLNAGFYLDKQSAEKLFAELKAVLI